MKIILSVFVVAAAILFFVLYGLPELQSVKAETAILASGSLSVSDREELCVIRSETLYRSDMTGKLSYVNKSGTKVRSGVALLSIEALAPPEESVGDTTAFERVLALAGDAAVVNPGNVAPVSALVSYYADGYEKILTPGAIAGLTQAEVRSIPANPVALERIYTREGDPIYKLTDNNLWYMVFWIAEDSGARVNYEVGRSVTLRVGADTIDAKVQSISVDGNAFKVVLSSDMYYKDMTRFRKFEADILFSERQGIVIDGAWIVAQNEQPGLYVKQKDGTFLWTPIRVRAISGNNYLIMSDLYYDADGLAVQTVNHYDEVLVNHVEYFQEKGTS